MSTTKLCVPSLSTAYAFFPISLCITGARVIGYVSLIPLRFVALPLYVSVIVPDSPVYVSTWPSLLILPDETVKSLALTPFGNVIFTPLIASNDKVLPSTFIYTSCNSLLNEDCVTKYFSVPLSVKVRVEKIALTGANASFLATLFSVKTGVKVTSSKSVRVLPYS